MKVEPDKLIEQGYFRMPELGENMWGKGKEIFRRDDTEMLFIGTQPPAEFNNPKVPDPTQKLEDIAKETKPKETEDFRALEERDEQQILDELKGGVIEEYVYRFQSGSRTVTGVSYAGIKHVMATRRISIENINFSEKDGVITAIATALDKDRDVKMPGVSEQSRMMKTRNGDVPDQFALQKVTSKAIRNAVRSLIDEKYLIAMINQWLENKK